MANVLAKAPDVIDTGVRGGVDLENIERATFGDFQAGGAFVTGSWRGAVDAVHRFGQKPGGGGFTGSAGAAEQVPRADPVVLEAILQCFGDVLLGNDILKALRTILSGKDEIAHWCPI